MSVRAAQLSIPHSLACSGPHHTCSTETAFNLILERANAGCRFEYPGAGLREMQGNLENQYADATGSEEGHAILDRDHLAQYTMGDAALEAEVLQLFISHSRTQIQQLEDAVGVPDRWHDASHGIKGSARGIGAWALATAAEAAERDSSGAPDLHAEHVLRLQACMEAAQAAIAAHIAEN